MPFAPKNTPVIRKNLDEQNQKKETKKKTKSAGRLTEKHRQQEIAEHRKEK